MSEPFIGQIQAFGFNFAPRGWANCEGQLLSISSYTALFSLIGTTYGGDGRSTFALPDLRGRSPMNMGTGPGLSSRKIGQKGGYESVIMNSQQMPAHNHTAEINAYADAATNTDPVGRYLGKSASGNEVYVDEGRTIQQMHANTVKVENAGGSQAHANMSPYLVVNYCIALVGIYPSRS